MSEDSSDTPTHDDHDAHGNYAENLTSYIVLMVVVNLYFILTTILFILKRESIIIQKRAWKISLISVICNVVVFNTTTDVFEVTNSGKNCLTVALFQYLFLPLSILCYIIRIFYLTMVFYLNKYAIGQSTSCSFSHQSSSSHPTPVEDLPAGSFMQRTCIRLAKHFISSDANDKVDSSEANLNSMKTGRNRALPSTDIRMRTLFKFIGWCIPVELVVYLICLFTSPQNFLQNPTIDASQCDSDVSHMYGLTGFLALVLTLWPLIMFALRNVRDTFLMKVEVCISLAAITICYVLYIVALHSGESLLEFHEYHDIFLIPGMIVAHTMTVVVPVLFAWYKDREFDRIVRATSGPESFDKVLKEPLLYQKFKVQLAKDFCIENGYFYEDYATLRSMRANNADPKAIKSQINKIYNNFIADDSPYEVNVQGKLKYEAKKSVEKEGHLSEEMLEKIWNVVYQNMYLNTFPKFSKSFNLKFTA